MTTGSGTSATSPADQFTFVTPAPTVTSVSPTSGTTHGGTVVTITGTDFTGATAVDFGAERGDRLHGQLVDLDHGHHPGRGRRHR